MKKMMMKTQKTLRKYKKTLKKTFIYQTMTQRVIEVRKVRNPMKLNQKNQTKNNNEIINKIKTR